MATLSRKFSKTNRIWRSENRFLPTESRWVWEEDRHSKELASAGFVGHARPLTLNLQNSRMNHTVAVKGVKQTIGFRIEEEYREALVARAEQLKVTVSELVKQYVIAGLREDAATGSLYDALCSLKEEIRESRRDLSLTAEVLLVAAGKLSEKDARTWARENITAN